MEPLFFSTQLKFRAWLKKPQQRNSAVGWILQGNQRKRKHDMAPIR